MRWRVVLITLIGGLLAAAFIQMRVSSGMKSAAFDETFHLTRALARIETGDPRLNAEHPPLAHLLAGLNLRNQPLTPFPTDHPGWQNGEMPALANDYIWEQNGRIAPHLIERGRLPLILLTCLIGLILFGFTRSIAGTTPALIALTLFAFDPNVLANGRMITTDMTVSGMMLLAVWRWWMWLERPSKINLILCGLAVGLAISSKLTAGLLAPIFILIAFAHPNTPLPTLRMPKETQFDGRTVSIRKVLRDTFLTLVGIGLIALGVLWTCYGFEIGTFGDTNIPIPLPTFINGSLHFSERIARGTPTYLLGNISDNGWWYYFPVVFLMKTPLPTIILMSLGIVEAFRNWRKMAAVWIPLIILLIVSINSPLQIGYRHILPMLLFTVVLAAVGTRYIASRRSVVAILVAWQIVGTLLTFPHYMAYSNMGASHSWKHLADMNVDWGQDLPALAQYQAEHPDETLYMAYFGSADPAAYGINAIQLPGFSRTVSGAPYFAWNKWNPTAGTYAISATSLHLGLIYEGHDMYNTFAEHEPDEKVGQSILIYKVDEPQLPVERVSVVGSAVWRTNVDEVAQSNHLVTKWTAANAIILPKQATYVINDAIPQSDFVQQTITEGTRPPFNYDETIPFGDVLQLIGHEIVQNDTHLTITTYWHPSQSLSLSQSLSIFIHVSGTDGVPVAQWDGWPIGTYGLEAEDVIVIEHPISLEGVSAGQYEVRVGVYDPRTSIRLGKMDGGFAPIGVIGQ